MVAHAHLTQQRDIIDIDRIGQFFQKHLIIVCAPEYLLSLVASARNMIYYARILDS